jgi:hypothetical protein
MHDDNDNDNGDPRRPERGSLDGAAHLADSRQPTTILVVGQLDPAWADWLGDVELCWTPEGQSLLRGRLDQAALYGILDSLRDRGVRLLSVSVGA